MAGVAVLLIVAIPALSMRLGLPAGSSEPVDSSAYKAYKLIDDKFGAGVNGPLLVVADLPTAISDDDLVSEQVRIGTTLKAENDVAAVAPIGASDDDTLLAFQVVPKGGPTAESTEQLVRDLRGLDIDGCRSLGVAGNASGNIDVSEKLAGALPLYLLVVVGLSLIILIFVFRSILVPITATIGFVLSLFAAFGGVTAVFQWGWLGAGLRRARPGPDPELPADPDGRRAVRARDGLPAVPGQRHARGVRPRLVGPPGGAAGRARRSHGGHRRGPDHDGGLLRASSSRTR